MLFIKSWVSSWPKKVPHMIACKAVDCGSTCAYGLEWRLHASVVSACTLTPTIPKRPGVRFIELAPRVQVGRASTGIIREGAVLSPMAVARLGKSLLRGVRDSSTYHPIG